MKLLFRDVLVRAWQRGYSPAEVAGCVVEHLGGGVCEIDITHAEYPTQAKGPPVARLLSEYLADAASVFPEMVPTKHGGAAVVVHAGPGTELKKLLSKVGITATPACSCNARARTMDANGVDWCEANLDTIVGWLRDEATKRGLPFLDAAGRLLVRRAIANARKAAS